MVRRKTRAFLFCWNPAKFPEKKWKSLSRLASAGSGDDDWNTGSGQPSEGDWAFGVKLGPAGKGVFARGRITKVREPDLGHEGMVWIHWDEFLDPREAENLLAFPRRATSPPQYWTPQLNGTEVKNFPPADLHRLWEAHVSLRLAGKSDGPKDLLIQWRSDRYEQHLRHFQVPHGVGEVVPLDGWYANNKELEELKAGGSLWVVTVRPNGRLWLVVHFPRPVLKVFRKKAYYRLTAAPNEMGMRDITESVANLRFTNRKPLDRRTLGQSAQMPGILTSDSAELLRRLSSQVSPKAVGLVQQVFPLRVDLDVSLRLPPDLSVAEAERIGDFVKTLVVPGGPEPERTHVSAAASAPGIGPSTKLPTGRCHSLPKTVRLKGTIKGKPRNGTRVGSGHGYVDVGLKIEGGVRATTIVLPAGLVMISKSGSVQNGLLVQDVRIVVPANAATQWILGMYCANKSRSPADSEAEFTIGPVTKDPAFRELFAVLAGRRVVDEMTQTVQAAVWEITDAGGLTPETRSVLATLPLGQ